MDIIRQTLERSSSEEIEERDPMFNKLVDGFRKEFKQMEHINKTRNNIEEIRRKADEQEELQLKAELSGLAKTPIKKGFRKPPRAKKVGQPIKKQVFQPIDMVFIKDNKLVEKSLRHLPEHLKLKYKNDSYRFATEMIRNKSNR